MGTSNLAEKIDFATLQDTIRHWISLAPGEFTAADIDRDLGFLTPEDRQTRTQILEGLVESEKLERVGSRRGFYRPRQLVLQYMDFRENKEKIIPLWLPFGLHDMVEIMPGIIIVAGEPNAGKTAFLLNIIKGNQREFKIHYFNSEMGALELQKRLRKFDDISLSMWNFTAYSRNKDFADVIFPNDLNIID